MISTWESFFQVLTQWEKLLMPYHDTGTTRLAAGAGCIRAERGRARTCSNILRNRPLDSRRIVSVCRYVGKRAAAGNGRGAVRTVQERYGLAAGNGCVRADVVALVPLVMPFSTAHRTAS